MLFTAFTFGSGQIRSNFTIEQPALNVDLDMRIISEKWIPKFLIFDQKSVRVEISRLNCARFEIDADFLSRIATMDETLVNIYDQEAKQQWMDWRLFGSLKP